jgi:hypothetical protein
MPEVPPESEKKYLPARQAVEPFPTIFSDLFARENDDIDRNSEGVLCARSEGFFTSS